MTAAPAGPASDPSYAVQRTGAYRGRAIVLGGDSGEVAGGFSGWQTATMTFQASGTSQVLSFLAQTSSPGAPPFLLLDGVNLTAVPEPTTWAMMLGGFGLIGFLARRRQRGSAALA